MKAFMKWLFTPYAPGPRRVVVMAVFLLIMLVLALTVRLP
jgi:hypothetical protein